MNDHTTRILRLKDKRLVEYAEYGDPHGKPVFYFHGCFGSLHQGELAGRQAKQQGIRLIAPNRPGIGRSSVAHFRSMVEYADDVRQIADKLGIDTFAILGASAGGCFALACEYSMPERVRFIGAAGCVGPMNVLYNVQQMYWFRRWFLTGCNGYPTIASWLLGLCYRVCKFFPERMYRLMMHTSTAMDATLYKQDGVEKIMRQDYEAVFLQPNGVRGLLLEIRMYFNWGFDVRNFPAGKRVFFWHGVSDGIVPWPVIRRISNMIPGAETMLYQGGHLTFVMREMKKILSKFRNEWDHDVIRRSVDATSSSEGTNRVGDVLYGAFPQLLRTS